ncbi:hypothetical protein RND71_042450 [Anisodus tanguticus]|uniref:PABS domain-containing protein n=1 Tax=Anisodus tanguticus TaxID=243964 RepID=A0AAE1QQW7_9SOLA|nr:hypothetical protein RND71_042450 [Anisodus tanguticus]
MKQTSEKEIVHSNVQWFEESLDANLKWSLSLNSPKTVFIMGGGEGSAAREALKHCSIQKVVMSEIDQVMIYD